MDQESVPFWMLGRKLKKYPPLDKNAHCDVCVIGAGISGLMTAYLLAEAGKKVIVLDDGSVAGGQTMRTTAHLASALDDRYYILEHLFKEEGARLAAESHTAAIDLVASLVIEHGIDCDFLPVDAYLFTPPNTALCILDKELEAAERAGLEVKMVQRCPFPDFDTRKALRFGGQAEFHPLKFIDKLCKILTAKRVEIHCKTHVTEIDKGYRIETDVGKHIRASHVVAATNSPITSRYFPHLKQAPYRTYVIAGKVPKNYVPHGLYYDTPDPYHYIRVATDGKGHDYLIVGGEDHRTAEETHLAHKYQALETWTRHRFPQFQQVTHTWSGQVLEPIDSLGLLGRVDGERYIVTGDSGNGLTHGIIGAILNTDLILGKKNPWEKLYDPHRITFKATGEFLSENLNSIWQYKDWFESGEQGALRPHCGKVLRHNCAVYKDEHNQVHAFSAVCPHLKAIVHWNEVEHCWECPAHGSRFDAMGKVIQGPSNHDLQPYEEKKKVQ